MKKLMFFILVLALAGFTQAEIVNGLPVDNLIAWYDANDIDVETYVDENDVMTTWPNRVPGGEDFNFNTISGTIYYEASEPVFNNAACVDQTTGAGTMRALGIADALDGKTFTIFTVVNNYIFGLTNLGGGNRLYLRGHQFMVGDPQLSAIPPTTVNEPAVRVYKLDADYDEGTDTYSNGYISLQINNDPYNIGSVSTAGQGSVITFGNGYLQFPFAATAANYGKFAELIIYDRALSEAEENVVGYYLAQKYDLETYYAEPNNICTLTISADPVIADTITPAAGTYQFLEGEVAEISADMYYLSCPDVYEFSNWSGDVPEPNSAQTTVTITMDGDKNIVANYTLSPSPCVTLTINTDPAGFVGATTPSGGEVHGYPTGATVPLKALEYYADSSEVFNFVNWSSNVDNPNSASTSITLNSNEVVTATFEQVDVAGRIPADNLIAWFDANDIDVATYVDENNEITTWPNKVGGSDLEISSGTMYYEASNPIFNNTACIDQITGTGVMRAQGLVDMLDGKTFTIFTVVDSTGGTGPGFTNNDGGGRLYGRGHQFYVGDPAIDAVPPTLVYTPSIRVYQLDADYDEGTDTYSNGSIRMQINNDPSNKDTSSTVSQGSVITFGNGFFQIPYTAGSGNYGKYAEIIIYDRALTEVEENAVGYYLTEKYNITNSSFTDPGPVRTLTISASPSFVDVIDPAAGTYQGFDGQIIPITAGLYYTACPDIYEFSNWTGGADEPFQAETTVTINGDQSITANYTLSSLQCVTLTINTDPAGVEAITPSAGVHEYPMGETVLLEAIENYVNCPEVFGFVNWSSNVDNPNSASTSITLNSNEVVTATFEDARVCGDQCHPYPAMDMNQDCKVDTADLALFASTWLECTLPECD